MERINIYRVGAISAVLYTVAVIAALAILITTGIIDAEGATEFLPKVAEHHAAAETGAWLFVIAPLFVALAGIGMYCALREAGTAVLVALAMFTGGGLLVAVRGMVWVGITYDLGPAYVNGDSSNQAALAAVGDTLDTFAAVPDLVGALIPGIGVAIFSAAALRTGLTARWVAWLGYLVAVFAGWFTFLGLVSAIFEEISFLGFVAFLAWMIAMAITLWKVGDPENVPGPSGTERLRETPAG